MYNNRDCCTKRTETARGLCPKACRCGIPRPASHRLVHDRMCSDPGQDTRQSSREELSLPPCHTLKNKASGTRCPAWKCNKKKTAVRTEKERTDERSNEHVGRCRVVKLHLQCNTSLVPNCGIYDFQHASRHCNNEKDQTKFQSLLLDI
jgi:hypothetical protein